MNNLEDSRQAVIISIRCLELTIGMRPNGMQVNISHGRAQGIGHSTDREGSRQP